MALTSRSILWHLAAMVPLQDDLLDALTDLSGDGVADVWHYLVADRPGLTVDEVISAVIALTNRGWVELDRLGPDGDRSPIGAAELEGLSAVYEEAVSRYPNYDEVGVYLGLTSAGKAEWRRRNPDPDRPLQAWSLSADFESGVVTVLGASEEVARRALAEQGAEYGVDYGTVKIEPCEFEIGGTGDVVIGVRLIASISQDK